jgi:hypothetical protein
MPDKDGVVVAEMDLSRGSGGSIRTLVAEN